MSNVPFRQSPPIKSHRIGAGGEKSRLMVVVELIRFALLLVSLMVLGYLALQSMCLP